MFSGASPRGMHLEPSSKSDLKPRESDAGGWGTSRGWTSVKQRFGAKKLGKPTKWGFPKIVGFPPKSYILIGFSIIKESILGAHPYFWKHPNELVIISPQGLGKVVLFKNRDGEVSSWYKWGWYFVKHAVLRQGSLNYPFWRDQTLQRYGSFWVIFSNNNALFGLVTQWPLQGVGILSGKLKTGSWTVTFWGVKVQTKTKQYQKTVFFWEPCKKTKQY